MKLLGKSYLLLGVGLVTGVAAAAQSYSIVNQRRAPERSLMLGLPFDGTAKGSLANLMQTARVAKDPRSMPTKREIALARQAFASEPLASSSLPILIEAAAATGKGGQARQLLQRAAQLTRRNNLLNAMLIDDATKLNDPSRAVVLLGRAMTVNYKVRDLYVGRMAAATVSPGALEALPPLLGQNPDWSKEYWTTVVGNRALIPNGAQVRLRIAGPPWNKKRPGEIDFQLIRELANLDPAMAFRLSQALGAPRPAASEILANQDFRREPRFAPLDWELLQSGDIGADIEPAVGRLVLSSLPSASGVAARQLVHIAGPGRYRLQWKVAGLATGSDASLKFRLACADRSRPTAPIAPAMLTQGAGSAAIDVRNANCSWYWATLELDTSNSAAGVDVELRQLSLRREGGAPAADSAAPSKP
ncbi:hypothetical protein [Sphingopyxis sp. H050]|jgi:hypothetical protein|uniref:hypothetical protein n=1 Tax=Sphingopyxis sp. H050 TaxID=1759072 RepID=UPI0007373FCC|nr:hypothetical protein [Sphingopyxis sp. H050]